MKRDRNGQFQLILNPTRDWNTEENIRDAVRFMFQLILNPTRDWNFSLKKILSHIPESSN